MNTTSTPTSTRRVVGNISLSLDGRVTGPAGDFDMSWVGPHAVTDTSRDFLVRLTESADVALLGRTNYEGFAGYWPRVADDPHADQRDRRFSAWLDSVEKVVFSTTLADVRWQNSRLADQPLVDEVQELRKTEGGDIVVLSSNSLIRALLAADLLDRLIINLCPEIVGAGGVELFDDSAPRSSWSLVESRPGESGATYLVYDRIRRSTPQPVLAELPRRDAAAVRRTIPVSALQQFQGEALQLVLEHLSERGATPAGPPYVRYHAFSEAETDVELGVPVEAAVEGNDDVRATSLPGGPAVTVRHIGAHDELQSAYGRLQGALEAHGREASGPAWEVYEWIVPSLPVDPAAWPMPSEWTTTLVQPVRP